MRCCIGGVFDFLGNARSAPVVCPAAATLLWPGRAREAFGNGQRVMFGVDSMMRQERGLCRGDYES